MTIGERIKQLRKERGFTQKELAERCGYASLTTINKIELGINSVPISVVEKIARVFGVSPSYIMGWEENKNNGVNNGIIGNQNNHNVITLDPKRILNPIDSAILTICESLNEKQKGEVLTFATQLLSKKGE